MFGGAQRGRWLWLGWVGAIALLGACTDDPTPLEPTATPSATPSPTPQAPPMPELALEDSEAGAIAFVEHYIEVFNYAANTGDVEPLRALSHPDCEGCESYATSFEEQYQAGGYNRSFEWIVKSTEVIENVVEFEVIADAYEYSESASSDLRPITRDEYEIGLALGDGLERQVMRFFEVVD